MAQTNGQQQRTTVVINITTSTRPLGAPLDTAKLVEEETKFVVRDDDHDRAIRRALVRLEAFVDTE